MISTKPFLLRIKSCFAAICMEAASISPMYPYLQKPNTRLVSGVNMTFMMNVLCEEELSDERLEEILEESRSYLRRVNLETNETEDESFF